MSTHSGTGTTPDGEGVNGGHDKALRDEIIESQKSQADFLKWKLISVAAVVSVSLGFAQPGSGPGARLLLCLVPFICLYVDLISLHIMIRIITIGIYLKLSGNRYERFAFKVRSLSAASPFVFEVVALHGSSLVFNVIILVLGIIMFVALGFNLLPTQDWPPGLLIAYIVAGGLGVAATAFTWVMYTSRAREVIHEAEKAAEK